MPGIRYNFFLLIRKPDLRLSPRARRSAQTGSVSKPDTASTAPVSTDLPAPLLHHGRRPSPERTGSNATATDRKRKQDQARENIIEIRCQEGQHLGDTHTDCTVPYLRNVLIWLRALLNPLRTHDPVRRFFLSFL